MNIAVVGAGILGRLIALRLASRAHQVTLFDENDESGGGASWVAGGMLAPFCEFEISERSVFEAGRRSLELWKRLREEFALDCFSQFEGTLIVAHPLDRSEIRRLSQRLSAKGIDGDYRELDAAGIHDLEPGLNGRFEHGLYFPEEGQVDPRGVLPSLAQAFLRRGGRLRFRTEVTHAAPFLIETRDGRERFDHVFDCRGMGARRDWPELRAVRGEIIWIKARGGQPLMRRPIRLLHPRHPLYLIPRPEGVYGLGATMIEDDDQSPVSVRSALELLSAAFALQPSLGEARILRLESGLRPALPDHLPDIQTRAGLTRANGLYRHGYLLGPAIAETACSAMENQTFALGEDRSLPWF